MQSGEPVCWPTALKIPPQVPLIEDGGAAGGMRWDQPAQRAATARKDGPSNRGGRDSSAGATAAASGPPRSRGSATLRPTCHQAKRLARWSSRSEHTSHSGGPATGMAGGRGDDQARAQQTKRSATQWSAAPCASSGPVRRAGRRSRNATDIKGPRAPATGRAAVVITAGAAGLDAQAANGGVAVCARDGSPSGSRRRHAFQRGPSARCAARQPGPAQRGRALRSLPSSVHHHHP